MKNTKYIAILIVVILFSVSCKKEVGLIEVDNRFDVNKNSQFTTLWQNKLSSPYHYGTFVNLVYENVIYTSGNTLGNKTTVSSFNKKTGKKNWEKTFVGPCIQQPVHNGYSDLLLNINNNLVSINTYNGEEDWRIDLDYLQHFILKNHVIYAFFGDDYYGTGNIKLYKVDMGQGIRTHILTQTTASSGNAMQKIVSMSYWKHPNGNEILYLQSTTDYGRHDSEIYALDITNDSIYDRIWHGGYKTLLHDHIIVGNNIYFNQVHLATKYNMLTKSENFRTFFGGGTGARNSMVLDNGFLYTSHGENYGIMKLDTNNGNITYLARYDILGDEHTTGNHLFVKNNKLYYSTPNSFIVLDITSSKITHRLNRGNTLNGIPVEILHASFVVDPANGYIYTGWKNNITCIKPN